MTDDLDWCLRSDVVAATIDTAADWLPTWRQRVAEGHRPIGLAMRGGFAADRLGWAFSAGYQAALRALLPDVEAHEVVALCITEAAGNRPRDIATTLRRVGTDGIRITGRKRWATLAPLATRLVVVGVDEAAHAGDPSAIAARPPLRAVSVAARAANLSILPMPETSFVPEVPHAEIDLQGVEVGAGAMLAGDGYESYVKPFRTVEDIHVSAATLAYLLREGRARAWPAEMLERIVTCLVALAALAQERADAPAVHVALAGVLQIATQVHEQAGPLWSRVAADDPAAGRWQRDVPLFRVASEARAQRARRAWERLSSGARSSG